MLCKKFKRHSAIQEVRQSGLQSSVNSIVRGFLVHITMPTIRTSISLLPSDIVLILCVRRETGNGLWRERSCVRDM